VSEITANSTMLLAMIVACFAAMLVSTLFDDRSILDSLKAQLLTRSQSTARDVDHENVRK
jgi:H+/Cl- antiporter ClcA